VAGETLRIFAMSVDVDALVPLGDRCTHTERERVLSVRAKRKEQMKLP
jgi:hypothetical protein